MITAKEAREKVAAARSAEVNQKEADKILEDLGEIIQEKALAGQDSLTVEVPGPAMAEHLASVLVGLGYEARSGGPVSYPRSNPPKVPCYHLHIYWEGTDNNE